MRETRPVLLLGEKWKLLLELCHFTQSLNPLWDTGQLQRSLKSLSQPAIVLAQNIQDEEERFLFLVDYFFKTLNFSIDNPQESQLLNSFMPQILVSRKGPSQLLLLLLMALLEQCHLKMSLCSPKQRLVFKVHLNRKVQLFDFTSQCAHVGTSDLIQLINGGYDFSGQPTPVSALVVEYLNRIANLARRERKLQILSITHSFLMKYQPFNLVHLSERAKSLLKPVIITKLSKT